MTESELGRLHDDHELVAKIMENTLARVDAAKRGNDAATLRSCVGRLEGLLARRAYIREAHHHALHGRRLNVIERCTDDQLHREILEMVRDLHALQVRVGSFEDAELRQVIACVRLEAKVAERRAGRKA